MTRRSEAAGIGALAILLAFGGESGANGVGGIPVEALTIRVGDAIGTPGGATAIVFRTYASRPIRRGRLASGVAFSALGGGTPIAAVTSASFFTPDGIVAADVAFDAATQALSLEFDDASAFYNTEDGVLGVLYVTLAAGLSPGSEFSFNLDGGAAGTFLLDPDGDEHPLTLRGGEISVRGAGSPLEVEVDGGEVHPGSGATVEIGTSEPFAIESATFVIQYEPDDFEAPPTVTTDSRHGTAELTVSYPAANRVKIELVSPGDDFNLVPGDVLRLHLDSDPSVPFGHMSALDLVSNESSITGPGGTPLSIAWEEKGIEFVNEPDVFRDGFESGDAWLWNDANP